MPNLTGETILNRYRVYDLLGRGGMAEVYKVWDAERMTYLAMKLLHQDMATDKIFLRRFRREASTLAKLQHPNIVRFYGFKQDGRLAFMMMDFIEGESLKLKIFDRDTLFAYEEIRNILRPIIGALQFAHNRGMVHCDIKPANIMIDEHDRVLLTDFGIARMTDAATATMVGAGTPAYMAPEQARSLDPTPQTDIYALGIVLFEMLTGGERPFTGEQAQTTGSTSEKVRWEQINLKPPKPSRYNPELPPEIEAVVLRCLEKEPSKRYPSALELLNAFQVVSGVIEVDKDQLSTKPQQPLPEAKVDQLTDSQQPINRKRRNLIPWLLAGFLALCGIITFFTGGFNTINSMLSARNERATSTSAAASAVVVAREQAIRSENEQATATAAAGTAVVAARAQAIRSAEKWPLVLLEPFNNNDNEWIDGEIDDEFAEITVTINGTYTWEISSKQGFVWWVYPTSDMVDDFYLAVDVINPSSNRDAPNGLIFRILEDSDFYYYFEVRDTQLFSVWASNPDGWEEVIPYTTSTAIRPSENNHLEIIAQGDEYFFYINDELVAEKTLLAPNQGYSGLAAGLSYEDEQSTIIFDNFELRAP